MKADVNLQKIAVLGFGAMGQMHTRCYQMIDQAQVTAVVAGDIADAKERLDSMQCGAVLFSTVDEALEKGDFDAVSICLPTDMHVPVAIQLLKAGKHVLCEKPLSSSVDAAKELLEVVAGSPKFFMVGHCIRFWPEYKYLSDLIESGEHGKLMNVHLDRRSSKPSYSQGNWLQDGKRSGGAILDLHIHDSDYIQHILGMPKAVNSIGNYDETGWCYVNTQYYYDDVVATATGGWDLPPKWGFTMAYKARFEKAFVEFDFLATPSLKITVGDGEATAVTLDRVGSLEAAVGNISDLGGYINETQYWIDCLEKGMAPTIATGQQAADSLRLIFAEMESAQNRQIVSL